MKALKAVAVSIPVIVILGACNSGTDGADPTTSPSSQRPSIGAPVKAAPEQDPAGRKPVGYDPCLEIGDTSVSKAGFDPSTRERSDQLHTGYAFIGCTFERKEQVRGNIHRVGSLTISSTDITLDQFREREQREGAAATEISVNGREAIFYKRPAGEACFVVMKGPDAAIDLQVDSAAALTEWSACDHAQEIAAIIESELPGK
ncbi:DUF3558 domain-containing protein [Nocardia wallacei]|uniref:DUF3558 domain-containing protein n=1 Tax=Nocardia wallacei TaxID=480035 RepID=UPI002455459A|nr:DUF3558 domain-containing protein [Nocardia wallacei]